MWQQLFVQELDERQRKICAGACARACAAKTLRQYVYLLY
jgi:hypothetical protein